MKEELKVFLSAIMFYTRIPCPKHIDHSPEYINKATRYFPFVGWLVGMFSFVGYAAGLLLVNEFFAVIVSLLLGVLLTGAFHEDGLADTADGFGGGWTKEKILEIMKDSRIGTYGVIALFFLFAVKFILLYELLRQFSLRQFPLIVWLFIAYHSMSRLTAVQLIFFSQYARADLESKIKPIATTHGWKETLGAYLFGLLPVGVLCYFKLSFVLVLFPLLGLFYVSKKYFEKWIQGYTGDCLGAVEQIAECFCLLSFFVLWKFF